MGYFVNRRFNLIYVHAALQAFTTHGGEAFAFVYLLKAGIAVPIVLLSIGALFGSRLLFRMIVLPLTKRVGLRNALVFGIVMEGCTCPILSQITGTGPLLVAYLALWAISSSIYWTTHHAYVVLIGDGQNRGAQVSVMEFIGAFFGIIAPLTTGLLLTWFAPIVAFSVVGFAMICSAIPLLYLPNVKVKADVNISQATQKLARLVMFTDGLRSGAFHFTWLIALFITLGASFAAYGGALSLAGLAGAFGYSDVWSAVTANAIAAIAWPIYATAFNSRVYALAQHSPCALRFHIIAEGGWDLGVALACFTSAALVYLGFGFFWPLILALIGCVTGYLVVARTFDRALGADELSSA
jgi:MFS transporter, DHA1 family, inner membrane transport protein